MSDQAFERIAAAEMLDVPVGAEPEVARSAFLSRLEDVDYTPPEQWCAGLDRLDNRQHGGGFAAGTAHLRIADRNSLRQEIETFARKYWELSPDERAERYAQLQQRATEDVRARRRLRMLGPGLRVEVKEFHLLVGTQAMLSDIIQKLFILPPLEQALVRNRWITQHASNESWISIVRGIRKNAPRLAALDSKLLSQLEQAAKPRYEPTFPLVGANSASAAESGGTKSTWWTSLLVFAVLMGVVRACNSNNKTEYRPSSPNIQQIPPYKVDMKELQMKLTTGSVNLWKLYYAQGKYEWLPIVSDAELLQAGVPQQNIDHAKQMREKWRKKQFDKEKFPLSPLELPNDPMNEKPPF